MKNYSLKKMFVLILVSAGIIPSLISIVFVFNQVRLTEKKQKLNTEKMQKSISFSINSQLSQIENKIGMLIDSSELTDYFRTPKDYRNLVENRLYGKGSIFIEDSVIPFIILVQGATKKSLLTIGNISSGNSILFSKEVRLNDLNMPEGQLYGFVTAIIDTSHIYKEFPSVKTIILDSNESQFEKAEVIFKTENNEVISLSSLIASILILIASVLIGFVLLRREVFEPIRLLTNKLLSNESELNINPVRNEIKYLENVTEEYVELVRKKEIQQVSAQVAHDIRSPLIALQCYLTKEGIDKGIAINALNRIESMAKRLGNKRFSQKESHFSPLKAVNDLIKEYSLHSSAVINLQGNDVKKSSRIEGSIGEFCAAISNIIDNAIDASKNPIINISLSVEENDLSIVITDNGSGMENPHLVFAQGYTTKGKGSGLGLYQVKKFVDSIQGLVSARAIIGGTTIEMLLPLSTKKKIVIIDDDLSYLNISKIRLSQLGYESILFSQKSELYSFVSENISEKYEVYVDQNIETQNDGLDVKVYLEKYANLSVRINSSCSEEGKQDWCNL